MSTFIYKKNDTITDATFYEISQWDYFILKTKFTQPQSFANLFLDIAIR